MQSRVGLRRVFDPFGALGAAVAFALLAGLLAVLVFQNGDDVADARGTPGTTWLSGEARGQVVLAAAGGELASVAVRLGADPKELDVVDTGRTVFVHDRASGEVLRLAGTDGNVLDRFPGPVVRDPRPRLVRAGESVYVVDDAAAKAQRVEADGKRRNAVEIGAMTAWVGTADGRLWTVDERAGTYAVFDGDQVRTGKVSNPRSPLVLSAVGDDPVVLDRGTGRVRFLRVSATVDPGAGGATAVLQEPSVAGSCAQVLVERRLRCLGPDGERRSMEADVPTSAASRLLVNDANAVVLVPGSRQASIGSWGDRRWSSIDRPDPSTRLPVSWATPGPLLVDDPGSRYALTAVDGRATLLDKFSRRTSVLADGGAEGSTGLGEGNSDSGTRTIAQVRSASARPPTDGRTDPPQANPVRVKTRSGRAVSVNVLASCFDPGGLLLAVLEAGPASPGRVAVAGGSRVVYTPPDDFVGRVVFPYTITNSANLRASSTVTVEVIGPDENTPPKALDDQAVTSQGVAVVVDALVNDTDDEGDALTISALGQPANGRAALTDDSRVRYEPSPSFVGTDSFTYTVVDGFGGQAKATVRITVTPSSAAKRPPVAVDDRATAVAGRRVSVDVLANDTDPAGEPLRVVSVGSAPGVVITIVNGQRLDVAPDPAVSGPVAFTYTIENASGLRATAQVLLVVEQPAPNRPPVAVDDRVVVPSVATFVNVTANDSDPDGGPLTVVGFGQPPQGRVTRSSPISLRYEPPVGFIGATSFDYTIANSAGLTASARVLVQVIPPTGSGPVARDDIVSTFPGDTATVNVMGNDYHPDGIPFSLAGAPVVRGGTAVVNADQTISFTPPDASLTTYTLTYTIRDVYARTASAQLIVSVVPRPVEPRPPVVTDDQADIAYNTPTSIPVLANDTDPQGGKLSLAGVGGLSPASSGSVSVTGDVVRFAPANGFSGLASFTYTAANQAGLKANGRVLVQVAQRPPQPPVATPDAVTIEVGKAATLDPLVNDSYPDGRNEDLRVRSVSASAGITATAAGRLVTITAGATTGTFTVGYVATGPNGLDAASTISVSVVPPPAKPPVAVDDSVNTPYQTSVTVDVLANDLNPDGGGLTVASVSQPSPAGATSIQSSRVVFTPASGFSGRASFTYVVRNLVNGLSATGTVQVSVDPCSAAAPSLSGDAATTAYGRAVDINLFANDASSAGTLTVVPPSATQGTVTVANAAQGIVTFTPATGSTRGSFSYRVRNACGVEATAGVDVTVLPPPSAGTSAVTILSGSSTPITLPVSNPAGEPLTYTIGALQPLAAGSVSGTGPTVTVNASPTYVGTATLAFQIDFRGGSSRGSLAITIVAPPRPTAASFALDATVGVATPVTLQGSGGAGTLTYTHQPLAGLTGSGSSLTYTGAAAGTVSFNYWATDALGQTSLPGTVTITVVPPPTTTTLPPTTTTLPPTTTTLPPTTTTTLPPP